jgi:hypothetical protein
VSDAIETLAFVTVHTGSGKRRDAPGVSVEAVGASYSEPRATGHRTTRQAAPAHRRATRRDLLGRRCARGARWCIFPTGGCLTVANASQRLPQHLGGEAGTEESSISSGDLGTLATGGCYAAESGSERLGAAVETAFTLTLQSEYPTKD